MRHVYNDSVANTVSQLLGTTVIGSFLTTLSSSNTLRCRLLRIRKSMDQFRLVIISVNYVGSGRIRQSFISRLSGITAIKKKKRTLTYGLLRRNTVSVQEVWQIVVPVPTMPFDIKRQHLDECLMEAFH